MLSIQIYCGLYHHIRCTFSDQTYYHPSMMNCLVAWQSHISPRWLGIDPSLPPLLAWGSSSLLSYSSFHSPHMRFCSPHVFEFPLSACEGSLLVCATLGVPTPLLGLKEKNKLLPSTFFSAIKMSTLWTLRTSSCQILSCFSTHNSSKMMKLVYFDLAHVWLLYFKSLFL